MKIGNLVKFIEWNDPHKDKLGIVTMVDRWYVQVCVVETNEKMWRFARHLELVK